MDAEVLDAVAVVDIAPNQATEWFDLVNGAYTASSNDWDTFSRQLSSTAGSTYSTAAVAFLGYVADHGKTELVGKLVADLRDLPSAYASSRQRAAPSWDEVVRLLGSGWANWDGSDATWAQFRDWTYTSANEQDADLYAVAYEKLNPLNGLPPGDRVAALTGLGLKISPKPAQPKPAVSHWDTVVRQLGSGWANWDGSEAGWAQFRDWTYTSANQQHPDMYAAAYEKLNPLNGLPLTERAAKLTELGFTVRSRPRNPPPRRPVRQVHPLWTVSSTNR